MMQYAEKLYIQQEARRYSFDYSKGTNLKVQFVCNKKHARMGGGVVLTPPISSSHIGAKVRWLCLWHFIN